MLGARLVTREMPSNVAAIDIGSNAVRLIVAQPGDGARTVVKSEREPVRLGADVFAHGTLGTEAFEKLLKAISAFKQTMAKLDVQRYRAVATSALREARNREDVLEAVAQKTGVEIELIDGEEEARMVFLAVSNALDLGHKRTALVDIGGGSTEVAIAQDGEVVWVDSFKLGTVRSLGQLRQGDGHFGRRLKELVLAQKSSFPQDKIDMCVGTGGNVEAYGDLRKKLLGEENGKFLRRGELSELLARLQKLSYEERIDQLGLRPDRADVIVPAGILLETLMELLGVEELEIPRVGLKDGLLEDLLTPNPRRREHQALRSAYQLGRRCSFDEVHADKVVELALELFDETKSLHRLDEKARFYLHVAALLHDVGKFINPSGHHKHSHYLIRNSRLLGLSPNQRNLIACIARYHRKSAPEASHTPFRELSPREKMLVTKLSALLRLAEALDAEHRGQIRSVKASKGKGALLLKLEGPGDLLLERWAVQPSLAILIEALGIPVQVAFKAS